MALRFSHAAKTEASWNPDENVDVPGKGYRRLVFPLNNTPFLFLTDFTLPLCRKEFRLTVEVSLLEGRIST